MINDFLISLTTETAEALYQGFGTLQYPAFIVMIVLHSIRYPVTKKEKIFLCVLFVFSLYWGNALCSIFSRITNGIVPGINMGVAFLFFLLVIVSGAYMLNIPIFLSLDAIIPVYILGRGLAIIGCIFTGCCHGFSCDWGIYSRMAEVVTVPTVFIDCVVSCAIVVYLALIARKSHYAEHGRVTAIAMILFGALRLVIDILRDNHKLLLMLTFEGFCGILYIVAGAIILACFKFAKR